MKGFRCFEQALTAAFLAKHREGLEIDNPKAGD
jgi:hypothetical protein